MTLVDLNRAGAALVEIVTKPDMRHAFGPLPLQTLSRINYSPHSTPEEAAAFVRSLQSILRHVGASDANMEKVRLRAKYNPVLPLRLVFIGRASM